VGDESLRLEDCGEEESRKEDSPFRRSQAAGWVAGGGEEGYRGGKVAMGETAMR
jgi:hypothetical protein